RLGGGGADGDDYGVEVLQAPLDDVQVAVVQRIEHPRIDRALAHIHGGLDMAPKPLLFGWGPRYGPQAPKCSGRPGGAVAALYIADSPRIVVAALRQCQDSGALRPAARRDRPSA